MMHSQKKEIRTAMISRRKKLAREDAEALSDIIQHRIMKSRVFERSSAIMAYMPTQNEVRIELLIKTGLDLGKNILLPRVLDQSRMEAVPIRSLESNLPAGFKGIREPDPSISAVDPKIIDLVILPGIAYDRNGYRIGFGGGYYDRFIPLLRKDCILLAPAYAFQVLDHIPSEPFDRPVHLIVTEKEILQISSNKSSFMW